MVDGKPLATSVELQMARVHCFKPESRAETRTSEDVKRSPGMDRKRAVRLSFQTGAKVTLSKVACF